VKVFVSSSWRNEQQQPVVLSLRDAGHDVYDFRAPAEGASGFSWAEIDADWLTWSAERFRLSMSDSRIERGFDYDMTALRNCDALVMVQPCGRSAALELGWACGAGKPTIVLLADGEPELMLRMADHFCLTIEEVMDVVKTLDSSA
jgi:hypothetical protein